MLSDLIRKDVSSEAEPNLVLCLVRLVDSSIGTPTTKLPLWIPRSTSSHSPSFSFSFPGIYIWRVLVGFKVKSVRALLVTVSNHIVTAVGTYVIDTKPTSTNRFLDYSARLALEFSPWLPQAYFRSSVPRVASSHSISAGKRKDRSVSVLIQSQKATLLCQMAPTAGAERLLKLRVSW